MSHPTRACLAIMVAVVILSGCTFSAPPSPMRQDPQAQGDSVVEENGGHQEVTETDAPIDPSSQSQPIDVPSPEEICVTPDDNSGITVSFLKTQGHGLWKVKPGWTAALFAMPMVVDIDFPGPVDPSTVKVRVEPEAWQIAEYEYGTALESRHSLRLLPDERTDLATGIGWVTLTVEQAIAADGRSFEGVPFSVRFFAFDRRLADAHPHLTECMSRLVVHVDP